MNSPSRLESDAIVVFAKAPVPGKVKTRLSPSLSPEDSADLYRAFLADIAATVGRIQPGNGQQFSKVLAYAGASGDMEGMEAFEEAGFDIVEQGEGDLGAKLHRVSEEVFGRGVSRLVIIGSDSPTIHREHFRLAFDLLEQNDVVLGPSFDGGYYLVALRAGRDEGTMPHEVVFEQIDWSSPEVLSQSWERAKDASLLCELLGFWYDVDTFEDLKTLRFHLLEYLAHRDFEIAPHTAACIEKLQARGVFCLP